MATALQEAYLQCQRVTKSSAKNFYYAFITLPKPQRQAIYAVYAFCRLCDDVADGDASVDDKAMGLLQVGAALEEAYRGMPRGETFVALADAAQKYSIPRAYLEEIIRGVQMDLTTTRYQTFEELKTYCYRVASAVGLVSVRIFAGDDPKLEPAAVDLGMAMQLTNIMRDVREDAANDRIYIPLDEMARFGYSPQDAKNNVYNDAFVALMRYQGERARQYFDSGLRLVPMLPRRSRACPAVLGGLYQRVLHHIEARGYNVFQERIGLSSAEKLTLALKLWVQSSLARHKGAAASS
ncbi:MAG: squalene synthase HpnD [Dehalococcoidia bacterium]|nr:squalene synthase HpnD [Dehalococcoidia bacterium]